MWKLKVALNEKQNKKSTWVFFFYKYSKFWSVSPDKKVDLKPFFSEECTASELHQKVDFWGKKLASATIIESSKSIWYPVNGMYSNFHKFWFKEGVRVSDCAKTIHISLNLALQNCSNFRTEKFELETGTFSQN